MTKNERVRAILDEMQEMVKHPEDYEGGADDLIRVLVGFVAFILGEGSKE